MSDVSLLPARSKATVGPPDTPGLSGLTTLVTGVVVVAALYVGREVLVPITLAVLLSFVLAPLVDLLRRIRLGRIPSVVVAVVLALGVILALGGVIGTQVAQLASEIPRYATTVQSKVDTLRSFTIGRLSETFTRLGSQIERAGNNAAEATGQTSTAPANPDAVPPAMPVEVRQPTPSPLTVAERILAPVVSPLETTAIVFIVAIFILLQQEDLRDRLIRLFGSSDLHRTTTAMDDAARRLSRYFLTQLALNTAFGCIIGTGLFFIGVPSPVLWGVLAGLCRFVPYVGAFISGALPIILAAAVDPGWSKVLWTAALFLLTEPVMGQVVEPVVYGHSTGLSPVSVIIAAIFWTWLWGPIGLILSMPLTLCLVVLGRHVDRLEFLDVLLGNRPPLTPIESFYQRLLAGDPDEVEDAAELLLKERSLSSYYDEVVLKGLQLAAADADRGVLTEQQLDRIREAVEELVDELAEYDDVDPEPKKVVQDPAGTPRDERELPKHPAPISAEPGPDRRAAEWRTNAPVLCIAGRGPLDETVSMMLAQLLGKHGVGAHLVPHEAASRGRIGALDLTGVAMICICCLDVSSSPTNVRYLSRRLRQRSPTVPILVCLWPSQNNDGRLRAAIEADHYAASLRDVVNTCLEAAIQPSQAISELVLAR